MGCSVVSVLGRDIKHIKTIFEKKKADRLFLFLIDDNDQKRGLALDELKKYFGRGFEVVVQIFKIKNSDRFNECFKKLFSILEFNNELVIDMSSGLKDTNIALYLSASFHPNFNGEIVMTDDYEKPTNIIQIPSAKTDISNSELLLIKLIKENDAITARTIVETGFEDIEKVSYTKNPKKYAQNYRRASYRISKLIRNGLIIEKDSGLFISSIGMSLLSVFNLKTK